MKQTNPPIKRLTVDRITEAKLIGVLAENGGRIMYISSEPSMLEEAATRQQSRPEMDVLLKGWGGETVINDRVTSGSQYVPGAHITVGITAQPVALTNLAKSPHGATFDGRGFLARFCFVAPPPSGPKTFATGPIDQAAQRRYSDLLRTIWALNDNTTKTVPFSPEAERIVLDFAREVEVRMHDPADPFHAESGWASKLRSQVARLALVLHSARAVEADDFAAALAAPVQADTAAHAVDIGRYLVEHALRAFGVMRADQAQTDAIKVVTWLRETQATLVRRRDVQRRFQTCVGSQPRRLDGALGRLVDTGHIRRRPGRAESYDVHPRLGAAS